MSASADPLFGNRDGSSIVVSIPGPMGRGWSEDQLVTVAVWVCDGCGALVNQREQHRAWHAELAERAAGPLS